MGNYEQLNKTFKTTKKKLNKQAKRALEVERPVWPFLLFIALLVIALLSSWDSYVRYKQSYEAQTSRNAVQDKEIKSLRDELKKYNDEFNQRFSQYQVKKAEEVRLASIQPSRPRSSQRVAGGCEQYRPLISQYPWNVETALAICYAESGGRANAVNAGDRHATCLGSYGLFQIDCSWYYKANLFDPATNIRLAYGKYVARQWAPWAVCRNKVVCVV